MFNASLKNEIVAQNFQEIFILEPLAHSFIPSSPTPRMGPVPIHLIFIVALKSDETVTKFKVY